MLTYIDPAAFLNRAEPFLQAQEAINSLIYGVTLRLSEKPEWVDTPPYLGTIDSSSGTLDLVAAMTPPHNLLLSGDPDLPQGALDELFENLQSGGWTVPGVTAESELAQRFAETWSRRTGQPNRVRMRMRLYELRQVIPPPQPPAGCLRLATLEDLETVVPWRAAFEMESLHEQPPEHLRELVTRLIQAETFYLWDYSGPVSMAASSRPTPHGVSIGAVYTPPEYRGRGYASACVAALSQTLLDSGKAFCTLFTDLDYPTSNSIYQKIGYYPLCDFHETHFGDEG